ncbi:hypothetical protein SBA1_400027 [Candidatus Sulfotelmatobacter kueseliae]|uniref:Uncharacterized protein n=1 Tax=Candidatus Sulfotelmatobacter kueseliae TaxID=2042962 RepID=A0A2U3KQH8_9BACT|nr:hypothetical protein SBA1_400027 [Candidatus Sulfotelmatobacter kueseliae]
MRPRASLRTRIVLPSLVSVNVEHVQPAGNARLVFEEDILVKSPDPAVNSALGSSRAA